MFGERSIRILKMKLLILTQKVDRNDPVLGFFHRWIEKFAEQYEKITVICLEQDEYNLPENVKVLSLGKESGQSKLKYLWRFYKYIWQERKNYNIVFVHMNQEYVLLGGKFWLLWGKKIFMWRNHHAGNFLTDLASLFCHQVFCTSKYSYTAKYKKTVLMPVGVDTELFKVSNQIIRIKNAILSLGRIAQSKNVDIFIEALGLLAKKGISFTANIYGDALPKDVGYLESLKSQARELGLGNILKFYTGVPNHEATVIYNTHEIFINLSSSGMYDKTIFEAMACGTLPLSPNDNLRGEIDDRLIFTKGNPVDLAQKLKILLNLPAFEAGKLQKELRDYVVSRHSIELLTSKLSNCLYATL